jgi:Domain of unknown function (DUF4131)
MPIFDNAAHELTGRISSPLDRDPGRTAFELDLDRIDDREASGTVRVTVRDEALPAGYGDRVSLSGRLYPPRGFRNPGGFDYPAYLATETETRYRENGATVYRTDRHGAITVRLSPDGLDVQPWSELLLRQAAPSGQGGWWTVERSNWKRVAIRTAGI